MPPCEDAPCCGCCDAENNFGMGMYDPRDGHHFDPDDEDDLDFGLIRRDSEFEY